METSTEHRQSRFQHVENETGESLVFCLLDATEYNYVLFHTWSNKELTLLVYSTLRYLKNCDSPCFVLVFHILLS